MLVDEGLEFLTEEEAIRLLATRDVGRVGITMGAMPVILPVNFIWLDGAILFRTAPGSKLSAAVANNVVAFEVDDYDATDRSGWSVLVVGQAMVVQLPDVAFNFLATKLAPLVDGARTSVVRIEPGFVSGRRIIRETASVN